MKKTLILTHEFKPFRGGIGTYCENIAIEAVNQGHDVTVLAPAYDSDQLEGDLLETYRVVRYPGSVYSTKQLPKLLWSFLTSNYKQFDVIHATDFPWVCVCHFLQKFISFNYVVTIHGTEIFGFLTSKVTKLLGIQNTLATASTVFANSQFTADLALKYHNYLDLNKVKVTLLGVNPYWFQNVPKDSSVLQKLFINPDKKILLTVARLVSRKGHRAVLKALAMLPDELKQTFTYVIVGKKNNSSYEKELVELAAVSAVEVVFTGEVETDDVRELYQLSWLYVMIGERDEKTVEGFGLSYLEAAAQGLPSLATRVGGIPEVVVHGRTGWLVEDEEPAGVAEAIEHIYRTPDLIADWSVSALSHAENFTWERCVSQTYG